ncbi:hypothetical protein NC651_016605 [Populus alba x Populus x berolinensis]|nr:hypothetical protein NC651_016605 [Populus alba x Populus x berolinensis]
MERLFFVPGDLSTKSKTDSSRTLLHQ